MKRMDFLCASPASTAICTSLDQRSMVRKGIRQQGRPNTKSLFEKRRRSVADMRGSSSTNRAEFRRRSSADISDVKNPDSSSRYLLSDTPCIDWIEHDDNDDRYATALVPIISQSHNPRISKNMLGQDEKSSPNLTLGWVSEPEPVNKLVSVKPKERRTSSSSSGERYHVPPPASSKSSSSSSMMVQEWASGSRKYVSSLAPTQNSKTKSVNVDSNGSPPLKSSSSARSRDQVVVLRVSIHCKGCEGKVRKHISKMEGVTSFKIDLAAKKVTIVGDVTPLGVLASISKVKNAQIWPSSTSSSPLYDPSPRWST